MKDSHYRALLTLMMCSDPWPVADAGAGSGRVEMEALVDDEARERGFDNWIVAYHDFNPNPEPPAVTSTGRSAGPCPHGGKCDRPDECDALRRCHHEDGAPL